MATKTITQFSDDLDGSTDDIETIKFALHGTTYEIDLSTANQDKLASALEPFVNAARKAGSITAGRKPAPTKSSDGPVAKDVRSWAAVNDITVPQRGRIPHDVIVKFQEAHA